MLTEMHFSPSVIEGRYIILEGYVQGVGFRPFAYRLAQQYGLKGWIKNETGRVEIYIKGNLESLDQFCKALLTEAPPLAEPNIISNDPVSVDDSDAFTILPSKSQASACIHLPPDYFMCDDCLAELQDHDNRRYHYPFINCTQCGPRYTLIKRLPYDRPNTTMAIFPLCSACRSEYENPLDRRFHAQPLACPACGPQLFFKSKNGSLVNETQQAFNACVKALQAGHIVAIKGVGGYHLACDAQNDEAVKRLRANKARPVKPLAIMFPLELDLDEINKAVILDKTHESVLRSPTRPIVLVRTRTDYPFSREIAPGLNELGVMLPYSPLHYLLLEAHHKPLVMTSANISGEPVLTDNLEVETRLGHVADAYLHHDRPIERHADDPVLRVIAGKARPVRLGRGMAPLELGLPFTLPFPLLAVGGHIKNTVALGWERRAVISPHIGDLNSPRSLGVFVQVIKDLQALYSIEPQHIICDGHPHYGSTRWALKTRLPVTRVYHHHAHASSLCAEFPDIEKWLIFTWDGVGYGPDGTLWGGETLFGRPGHWQRAATFRPFHLPGGEKASLQPWRSALALCWEAGVDWKGYEPDSDLLFHGWKRRINCPQTSAVGRLFDAAAALIGITDGASYEGQAPMMLEALADGITGQPVMMPITRNTLGILETDWAPLLPGLMNNELGAAQRAATFHSSLADNILSQARRLRDEHGEFGIGLSGGVFQNRLLTEQAIDLLNGDRFQVYLPERLPCNDAGISFGQIIEAGQDYIY